MELAENRYKRFQAKFSAPKYKPKQTQTSSFRGPVDHSAAAKPKIAFRPDIEALRAIAIVGVMAFHYGLPVSGGFVGVDVFFVISGYLITNLLASEMEGSGTINLPRFYGRRARRLLPAALCVTVATLISGYFIVSPPEQEVLAKSAASSSLYVSNFFMMKQAFDYFAPELATNPFLHTWTLSVEEQFYLFWPALLLFATRRFGTANVPKVLVLVAFVSFVSCVYLTCTKEPWAFYTSPARAWEFALGGIAAFPAFSQTVRWMKAPSVLGWVCLAAIVAAFVLISDADLFPGWIVALPVLGTVGVLVSSGAKNGPVRLLQTAPFQWVGRNSYAMYLWHWPIFVYARILFPQTSWVVVTCCIVLTLALSEFSYHFLEHPVRSNKWLSAASLRSIGLGAILTASGAAVALLAFLAAKSAERVPMQQQIIRTARERSLSTQTPGCLLTLLETKPYSCSFGDLNSGTTIALFGDSHADQWSTVLDEIGKRNHWKIVAELKSSCSPFDIPVYSFRLRRDFAECGIWRRRAIAQILRERPSLVMIGEFNAGYVYRNAPEFGLVSLREWSRGAAKTVSRFAGANAPVLLIRDIPLPGTNVPTCLSRALWHREDLSKCSPLRPGAVNAAYGKEVHAIAPVLDLTDKFCGPVLCPVIVDGRIVYKDPQHVSDEFSKSMAPQLQADIRSALAKSQPNSGFGRK